MLFQKVLHSGDRSLLKGDIMKILLSCMIVLLLISSAYAKDVSLAWEASDSAGVAGYAILAKDFSKAYPIDPQISVPSGQNILTVLRAQWTAAAWIGDAAARSCTVTVPADREVAFVAIAFGSGSYDLNGNTTIIFSGHSNEVKSPGSSIPINPPKNVSIIATILAGLFFPFIWIWRKIRPKKESGAE
jgi:hypothetical protein